MSAEEERAAVRARAKTILRFLNGEGPLDGAWFGEKVEGRKPYWWRHELRTIALAIDAGAHLAASQEGK